MSQVRHRRQGFFFVVGLVCVALASCDTDGAAPSSSETFVTGPGSDTTTDSSLSSDEIDLLTRPTTDGSEGALATGELKVIERCVVLDSRREGTSLVIWPEGTTASDLVVNSGQSEPLDLRKPVRVRLGGGYSLLSDLSMSGLSRCAKVVGTDNAFVVGSVLSPG